MKLFSSQIKECSENGNLIQVEPDGQIVIPLSLENDTKQIELICYKYNKVCNSSVCKDDRL